MKQRSTIYSAFVKASDEAELADQKQAEARVKMLKARRAAAAAEAEYDKASNAFHAAVEKSRAAMETWNASRNAKERS